MRLAETRCCRMRKHMRWLQNNNVFQTASAAVAFALMWQTVFAGPLRDGSGGRQTPYRQVEEVEDEAATKGAASLPADMRIVRDVPYGGDAKQRFDVYAPRQARSAPIIFMVHGGAWRIGDKAAKSVIVNKVARWVPMGFILISTNYRLLPQADPMRQARDVARALAVAQNQAASWGGDGGKFILMGHSAGAHLVSLLATAPQISSGIISTSWLGTISLDTAALDVVKIMEEKHARLYDRAFGRNPEYWRSVSPFHAVTGEARPILVVCSTRRGDSCRQADRFVAKASSLGVKATTLKQNLSHREINLRLGKDKRYTVEVESFMASLDRSVARALK